MSSIFLSHNHADKPFARRLAADLRLAGHTVWIDEVEINIGDSLVEKIREGLDQVDFVAALLSPNSIDSPWVQRELDIAANREMKERRVVVLPLLLSKVEMPGFLEGKLYGDFTDPEQYQASFDLLLRKLGPVIRTEQPTLDEVAELRAQLAQMKAVAAKQIAAAEAHQRAALRGKSEKLKEAILKANAKYPLHAPINNVYAFEAGPVPVTLDYLMWSAAKAMRKGAHVLEAFLDMSNTWSDAEAMMEAYDDLLESIQEQQESK